MFSLLSGDVSNKNYLKLYGEIEKSDSYDENKLLNKFKGQSISKNLSATKNQLSSLILKSLAIFYIGRSSRWKIRLLMRQAEILAEKSLHKQSKKLINKAMKLAESNEDVHDIFEIFKAKRRLDFALDEVDFEESFQKEKQLIYQSNIEDSLSLILDALSIMKMVFVMIKFDNEKERITKLMDEPVLTGYNPAGFYPDVYYHRIYVKYYDLLGDTASSFTHAELVYEIFKKKKIDSEMYCINICEVIYEYVFTAFEAKKNIDYDMSISSFLKFSGISDNDNSRYMIMYKQMLLAKYFYNEDYNSAGLIVNELNKIHFSTGTAFYPYLEVVSCNFAYSFFFRTKRFDDAIKSIDRLLFQDSKSNGLASKDFARLLKIIIHYELENYDIIESLLRNTRRYFIKTDRLGKVEEYTLSLLRTLLNITNPREVRNEFNGFVENLNILEHEGLIRFSFLERFIFDTWLSKYI